jgi:hypothetical protein
MPTTEEMNLQQWLEPALSGLLNAMSDSGPKKPATKRFERFALTLLICAPSDLWEAWTAKDASPKKIEEALDKLNFSAEFKPLALAELKQLFVHRLLFKALGDTLHQFSTFYILPPPHPIGTDANKIIDCMKQLGRS